MCCIFENLKIAHFLILRVWAKKNCQATSLSSNYSKKLILIGTKDAPNEEIREKAGQLYGQQKIRGFLSICTLVRKLGLGANFRFGKDDKWILPLTDVMPIRWDWYRPWRLFMDRTFLESNWNLPKERRINAHIWQRENFYGLAHGIVGGGGGLFFFPPPPPPQIQWVGVVGFARKNTRHLKILAICYMGDGAVRQGSFSRMH